MKEPKYYFYDHASIVDDGAHLENIVASALLKELQFLEDTQGVKVALQYLRTKEGKEVDFVLVMDNEPTHLIEVKNSDSDISKHFSYFSQYLPKAKKIQLVRKLQREKTYPDGVEVRGLINWLANIDL